MPTSNAQVDLLGVSVCIVGVLDEENGIGRSHGDVPKEGHRPFMAHLHLLGTAILETHL